MLIGAQAGAGAWRGLCEDNAEGGRPGEMKAKLSSSIQTLASHQDFWTVVNIHTQLARFFKVKMLHIGNFITPGESAALHSLYRLAVTFNQGLASRVADNET